MFNKKAQVAIEYIIFISIFLLFFNAVILPAVDMSKNVVNDVYDVVQANKTTENLKTEIESLASSYGEGKKDVFVYFPNNTSLDCNNISKQLEFRINISDQKPKPKLPDCNNSGNYCVFKENLYLNSSYDLSCDNISGGYKGYLEIKKTAGDLNVSIKQ